ncbi:hypothetical protein DITRI_Ditri06bG0044700 [Diplodiscus trichospermus]
MSTDNIFEIDLSLIDFSPSSDFAKELENYLTPMSPENDTSKAQEEVNQPIINGAGSDSETQEPESGATKRKRKSKARGKSTKKRPFIAGESSASQQPEPKRKEKSVKELLEETSVPHVVKILRDRVDRRIKNDQKADMESCICLLKFVMTHKMFDLWQPILNSLNQIKMEWPPRSDLKNIKESLKEIEDAGKASGDTKQRLIQIGDHEIKRLDKQRREIFSSPTFLPCVFLDSILAKNLEQIFISEGVSVEILREKLSSAFPWLFLKEIATDEPTAGQDQESLQTHGQLEYAVKQLKDLENEIFAKDNNKVDVSDFQGLEDAIRKTIGVNIPVYLEPIANKIKEARGKATDFAHINIQVLVSAAIHEMEQLGPEKLSRDRLLKWGATFNKAKELGFEVEFAERQLKTVFYAYFGVLVSKVG